MNVLIDTCIIIDALQNRQPFAEDAQKLFLHAANHKFTGCITAKSSTDIYYLSHRYTHDDRASREILNKLFTLFELLDTDGTDCRRALASSVSDYEDAVMIETALRERMDYIVTRNTRDYTKSSVPVCTPAEFLALLSSAIE